MAEGDAKLGQPGRVEGCHSQGHCLGIGSRAGRADELNPHLGEFVLSAGPGRLITENAAHISNAQWQGLIIQPGAHDPGGGDGHVGAQGQGTAMAIEKAVHLGFDLRPHIGRQGVRVFKGGQDDLTIAPGGPGLAQGGF